MQEHTWNTWKTRMCHVTVCVCVWLHCGSFPTLGKHSSSTYCRETSPTGISGFFIYYAVSYYIKRCLHFFFFFLHPSSWLLVLSLSGRIIWNPLRELWSPTHLFKLIHALHWEGLSRNLCLHFPMDQLNKTSGYFFISLVKSLQQSFRVS